MQDKNIASLNRQAQAYSQDVQVILHELKKVIVGQDYAIERLLISTISDGHTLLEGMPGLAKTLMINSLAETVSASFRRIQFTPDLLPADIVGTKIYDHATGTFSTKKGPIFANFILADEINRAPPKVQSALLEAMQERQVTISGDTFPLAKPFLVLATQNPIEVEGTYSLPEAQVDRFMFKVSVGYPDRKQEKEIISRMSGTEAPSVKKVISTQKLLEIQHFVRSIYADEKISDYVTGLVHATRKPAEYKLELDGLIEYGASPRASIWMVLGAKAHALLQGRGYVIPEDVRAVAPDILRHRLILTYEGEAEGITADSIIEKIIKAVKVP